MDKKYPSLLYFGNTEQYRFPLVLVFGREPATTQEVGNFKGKYDFRTEKNKFWDQSYTQIALTGGITSKILKDTCAAKNASPILFATPFPAGIDDEVKDKWAARAAVSADACRAQVAKVFAFESLLRRVNLIIASGLDRDEFSASYNAILEAAGKIRTPVVTVPYFGESFRKPENGLFNLEEHKKIAEVIRTFATS